MPVKQIRPGTYIDFVGDQLPTVLPSLAGTVAIPLVSSWGPAGLPVNSAGVVTPLADLTDYDLLYGSDDTAGRRAVIQAFKGQGVDGGGAGAVLPYRMIGSAGALATVNVPNTTPATALTLTAKYKGTRGNRIQYQALDDVRNAVNDIFRIFLDGVKVEEYVYANTDIAGLRDQINAASRLVTATAPITGVALGVTNPAALPFMTGGNDGSTLAGSDWTAMQTALEFERYIALAPYDLTDPTIRAALVAWTLTQVAANRPFRLVLGGDNADTIATAITRSSGINDPHVINVGVGTYYETQLARVMTTSELAPRVAGILAARGEERALTFAHVPDLQAGVNGATGAPDSAQIESAIQNGIVVFSRAISPTTSLHIEMGKTTYTSKNNTSIPYDVFSDPRLVGIMDLYIRRMKEWGDEVIVGDTTVTDDSRNTVYGQARKLQDDLLRRGLILPEDKELNVQAPFVNVVRTTDDTIPYDFGWQFARTANFVLGRGRVR